MISAVATVDDGTRIILLGVSRENITRLTAGKPIRIKAETHPGFPLDIVVGIIFGETDAELVSMFQEAMSAETKIIVVPREPGSVS